jgi:hypothetical protein
VDVNSTAPPDASVVLYRDGREVSRKQGASLTLTAPSERAVYRVEVYLAHAPQVPWLFSNPIYVGGFAPTAAPALRAATRTQVVYGDGPTSGDWCCEKSTDAVGALDVVRTLTGTRLRMRYALSGSTAGEAYVAMGMPAGRGLDQHDRIAFRAQADKPMRLWVQLFMQDRTGNRYWRRSVYVDNTERDITIPFSELSAVDGSAPNPPLEQIELIYFGVDQTHTPLGRGGTFWIDDVRYER